MDQWKAKREAVGNNTTCVQTQTADINPSTDETMQSMMFYHGKLYINNMGFHLFLKIDHRGAILLMFYCGKQY
jgi:hypothetical protein